MVSCFKINEKRQKEKKKLVKFLLVFDDCLSREHIHNKTILKLFQWGRIYKICPLVLNQSISQIHPDLKRNTDILFLFKPVLLRDKLYIWENWLCSEFSKNKSLELLNRVPAYHSLVINLTAAETSFGLYKAPLID